MRGKWINTKPAVSGNTENTHQDADEIKEGNELAIRKQWPTHVITVKITAWN